MAKIALPHSPLLHHTEQRITTLMVDLPQLGDFDSGRDLDDRDLDG